MGFASRSFGGGHTLFDARARERAFAEATNKLRSHGESECSAVLQRLPILYLLCQTSIRVNTGFTSSPSVRPNSEESDPPTNVVFMARLMCVRLLFPQEHE